MADTTLGPRGLTKNDSLIIKGVAIIALLWNHCFLAGRFNTSNFSFAPFTQSQVTSIASFCKICVSLFAFVSGYGLYCSLQKCFSEQEMSSRSVLNWYTTRYIRSFSTYWFIVPIAWIACQLLDMHTQEVYFGDSLFAGICNMALEFFGLSKFFGTPMLIATWWYMGAALAFILLAPALYWIIRRFGSVLCLALVFMTTRAMGGYPGGVNYLTFLPAFIIGMSCAHLDAFGRLRSYVNMKMPRYGSVALVCLLAALCFLCLKFTKTYPRKQFWDVTLGLFTVIYVSFIVAAIAKIPVLNTVFAFLGKWSADIFIVHSFLRVRYARAFIYAPGHFSLVIIRLLCASLVICLLIRGLRHLIRYDALMSRLEHSINRA